VRFRQAKYLSLMFVIITPYVLASMIRRVARLSNGFCYIYSYQKDESKIHMLNAMFFYIYNRDSSAKFIVDINTVVFHLDSITSIETLDVPMTPGQTELNICLTFKLGDLPWQKTFN